MVHLEIDEKGQRYLDINAYTALIQQNFPQLAIQTVKAITKGWDSFALEVNDELIFRFPMRDDVIEPLQREIHLLPILEQTLSTPIPHFEYIGRGNADYPYSFVGYRKIGSIALDDSRLTQEQLLALAPALATFLNELHSFPIASAIQLGMQEHTLVLWREIYQERYIDLQKRVFSSLDTRLRMKSEQLWENFLNDKTLFTFQPTLIHRDLSGEHIFCEPERGMLTGVIDWGDVSIGDPAIDFVGLHWVGGKQFVEQILMRYQNTVDTAFWQRIDFYLHYWPFSQLLYGSYSENKTFTLQGIEGLRVIFGE